MLTISVMISTAVSAFVNRTMGGTPTGKVTLTIGAAITGPGQNFCIEGEHSELAGELRHITGEGGVEDGGC